MQKRLGTVLFLFSLIHSPFTFSGFDEDLSEACRLFREEEKLGTMRYTGYLESTPDLGKKTDELKERYFLILDQYADDPLFLKEYNLCQRKAFAEIGKKYPHKKLIGKPKPDFYYLADFIPVSEIQFDDKDPLIRDARKSAKLEDMFFALETYADGTYNNTLWSEEADIIREYRLEVSRLSRKNYANVTDREQRIRFAQASSRFSIGDELRSAKKYAPNLYKAIKALPKSDRRYERFFGEQKPLITFSQLGDYLAYLYKSLPYMVIIGGVLMFLFRDKPKPHKKLNQEALAIFGKTKEERYKNIITFFDKPFGTILFAVDVKGGGGRVRATMIRDISNLTAEEINHLVTAYLLYNEGYMSDYNFYTCRYGILYGQGQGGRFHPSTVSQGFEEIKARYKKIIPKKDKCRLPVNHNGNMFTWVCSWFHDITSVGAQSSISSDLQHAVTEHPNNATVRYLYKRLNGEHVWSTKDDLQLSLFTTDINQGYRLGTLIENEVGFVETDIPVNYDEGRPVMLFGGTGEGKTQCFALPILTTWKDGACVVLDVKGELYRNTSKWRSQHGSVYRFNPLDPSNSLKFNPLSEIRDSPQYIYEDSKRLAWHMVIPKGGENNAHWEESARNILTAAIAVTCTGVAPDQRSMSQVLDIIAGVGWSRFVQALKNHTDPELMRTGYALDANMNQKEMNSILSTLRTMMAGWGSNNVRAVTTGQSDWHTSDFRAENQKDRPPTLYIQVDPANISQYLPVIRTILGVHMDRLYEREPKEQKKVLFLLDEMPMLDYMATIETAFSVGRSYGISLFTIAQSKHQIENIYPQAKTMFSNAAVRLYLSPKMQDGMAQDVSDELGKKTAQGQTSEPNVSPEKLAQGEYDDKVIVLGSNSKPLLLKRRYFGDSDLDGLKGELPTGVMKAKIKRGQAHYPQEFKTHRDQVETKQDRTHKANMKKLGEMGSTARPKRRPKK